MIEDAKRYIQERTPLRPPVAVVLGSGLGAFADQLSERTDIAYADIPGWPPSTAVGHAGKLIVGKLGCLPTAVLAGRAHLYEGNSAQQVVHGVRVLHALGVKTIVLTNAAGGINLTLERGGLVLISDHINLQACNPLIGPNDETLGPRFPDMSDAYPRRLRDIAKDVASQLFIPITQGVYAAVIGPNYETPAEIRYLRTIGADVVGMSTVLEVIAANYLGMQVVGISCVTNMAAGVLPQKLRHEEVLETGEMVRDTLVRYLEALLPALADECGWQPPETSEQAVETEEPPIETAEQPVEIAEPPAETEEQPLDDADPPVETEEQPLDTAEPPVETEEQPLDTAEPPVETEEQSLDTAEPRVETEEQPVEAAEQPPETAEAPVETAEQPLETAGPPTEPAETPAGES